MLPPAVDEAAASSGLRSSVRRRLGLHQRPFWGVFGFVFFGPGCQSDPHEITRVFRSKDDCNYSSARIRAVLVPGRSFPRGTFDAAVRGELAVCGLRVAARTHRLPASGRCDTAAVTRVAVALPWTHEQRDPGGSACCTNTDRRWRAAARSWRSRSPPRPPCRPTA